MYGTPAVDHLHRAVVVSPLAAYGSGLISAMCIRSAKWI